MFIYVCYRMFHTLCSRNFQTLSQKNIATLTQPRSVVSEAFGLGKCQTCDTHSVRKVLYVDAQTKTFIKDVEMKGILFS